MGSHHTHFRPFARFGRDGNRFEVTRLGRDDPTVTRMDRSASISQLSPRELQLIQFATQGLTDTAIALRLGISEATVGTYWGRVRIKIGPYNRTEIVSIFLRAQQEEALNELREQNAKLLSDLRAAAAVAEVGSLNFEIIENAPDAMILVSAEGIVQSGNGAARELFGYEGRQMEGISLLKLIPERYRERHREHREEYVQDPRRRSMGEHLETHALRKDGTEILVRGALSAMPTPAGLLITCVLREVKSEVDSPAKG